MLPSVYLTMWSRCDLTIDSGVTRRSGGTAPGDTLQGVTTEGKNFVGKFTNNSGQTRSDR